MSANLQSLLYSILEVEPNPECIPYTANLHTLVDAELAGAMLSATDLEVKQHVTGCASCAQEYRELKAILQLERDNQLVAPPLAGAFDFAYLHQAASTPAIWESIERAGQRVEQLLTDIRVFIGQNMASFGQGPIGLSPQWLTAPAIRSGSSEVRNRIHLLSVPSLDHDITVNLMVGPVSDRSSNLGIQVLRSSNQQPLDRVRITLRDAGGHVLVSQLTGLDGRLELPYLAPGAYAVEVKYQGILWALPLTFAVEPDAPE